MSSKIILVVGGAGFIGSHVTKMLASRGYLPLVFDNLSSGHEKNILNASFIKGDLANPDDLEHVFTQYLISGVMHFAALIDVGESIQNPAKYYHNNVVNTLNLLDAMLKHNVKTFIFSSSAAIFGTPIQPSIDENHPCCPINPYGETKLIVEKILRDYDSAYGLKSSCLRYFNAAGGDSQGKIKNYKQKESNLIPLILRNLKGFERKIIINGTNYPTPDGTCIRDYIHVEDLASAHILAIEKLFKEGCSTHYNLGNGNGFSIREVIHSTEKVTGLKVNAAEGPPRPGDPPALIANSQKAKKELGWDPQYSDLDTMITHAWQALEPVQNL